MTWSQVLDGFEDAVEQAERSLDSGDFDASAFTAFEAPAGIGPLPRELQERATAVLRRQHEVEQRLATAFESLTRELAASTRATNAGRRLSPFGETTVSRYFDAKG